MPPKQNRLPWMKWYPADWRADPGLQMCGRVSRSVWVDLIGLMHEATPYGHLYIAGHAPTIKQISAVLSSPVIEIKTSLDELEKFGVLSRLDNGIIYSRRMVRDKLKADKNRERGKLGGNPKLTDQDNLEDNLEVNPQHKKQVNGEVKAQIPETRDQKDASNRNNSKRVEYARGEADF